MGAWLSALGMKQYAVLFVQNGYDSLDVIKTMSPQELESIGVEKEEHRRILMASFEEDDDDETDEDDDDDDEDSIRVTVKEYGNGRNDSGRSHSEPVLEHETGVGAAARAHALASSTPPSLHTNGNTSTSDHSLLTSSDTHSGRAPRSPRGTAHSALVAPVVHVAGFARSAVRGLSGVTSLGAASRAADTDTAFAGKIIIVCFWEFFF